MPTTDHSQPTPRAVHRGRSAALAALAALGVGGLFPQPAASAPYTIITCGASGKVGGWQRFVSGSPTHIHTEAECPPSAAPPNPNSQPYRSGLSVSDALAPPTDTPPGTNAGWQITAPAGAHFTRAQWWRAGRKQDDDNFKMYFKYGAYDDPLIAESWNCTIAVGTSACGSPDGSWGYTPGSTQSSSYVDQPGLSTPSISFGVRCDASAAFPCMNGWTIQHVRALVYEARLTIEDPTAPVSVVGAGDAWTSTRWLQGDVEVAAAGGDPQSGVRATRVYIDGQLHDAKDRALNPTHCDWSMPTPCAQVDVGAPAQHVIDTTALEDGEHQVAVAAVNAAGAEALTGRPTALRVDNHAPGAVNNVAAARRGTSNIFDISWRLPLDPGSPITAAEYQLCDGALCGAITATDDLTSIAAVVVTGPADSTLRVRLRDAAGNEPTGWSSTIVLPYLSAPVDPPIDPPIPPDDRPRPPAGVPIAPADPLVVPPVEPPGSAGGRPEIPDWRSPATPAIGREAARLRIAGLRRVPSAVVARGTVVRSATGRIEAVYAVNVGRTTHRIRAAARPQSGRWTIKVRVPRELERLRGALTVRYLGDARVQPSRPARRTVSAPR